MGRAIDKLNAGKLDNRGIGHLANVAVGTVTGMPVDGLRLFETARSLSAAHLASSGRSARRQCTLPATGPRGRDTDA